LIVESRYYHLIAGAPISLLGLDKTFVVSPEGVLYDLIEWQPDGEVIVEAPVASLPPGSIFVARKAAILEFVRGLASTQKYEALTGGPRLAAWLSQLMKRKGLTVNRIHVLTGLDRKTIKAICAGKRVSTRLLQKLSEGLKIPEADIPTD
jgi:hypothetical protein